MFGITGLLRLSSRAAKQPLVAIAAMCDMPQRFTFWRNLGRLTGAKS